MLTHEENDFLTRVGPGTPAGQLLRRYWHAVAATAELTEEKPKKRVRILGEVAELLLAFAQSVLDHKYKLGRVLERGERALIVEAMHVELREPVAIKVLDKDQRDPRFAARLRRSARQSAAIRSEL